MALIPAVFTPFDSERNLRLDVVEQQAAAVHRLGMPAAYVCGSGGEGPSMTTSERVELIERWCEVAADGLGVIAHVGHNSLTEARTLAAAAGHAGVAAISAVPPFFYKPLDVSSVVSFCAQIASEAPELPFIYYHIPSLTGVDLPADEIFALSRERIPNFAGLKYASDDLDEIARCVAVSDDDAQLYLGNARLMLDASRIGVRVAIGSAFNVWAPMFARVVERIAAGDDEGAATAQRSCNTALSTASRFFGQIQATKALTHVFGPDCGPCRPPLQSLSSGELDTMRRELGDAGDVAVA